MAQPITQAPPIKTEEVFVEKHFSKIAFAISTLVLMILSPLALFLGTAVGFAMHSYMYPKFRMATSDKIVTIPNSTLAIVGATASILSLTPAGSLGSPIFNAIPLLSSIGVGLTLHRGFKTIFR